MVERELQVAELITEAFAWTDCPHYTLILRRNHIRRSMLKQTLSKQAVAGSIGSLLVEEDMGVNASDDL